jgi:Phage integrase family
VLAELPACDGPMLTCKPVEPPSRSRDCRQPRRPRWITEDPGHGGPSSSTPTRRCCGEIGSGRLASGCLSALALLITVSCSADLAAAHCLRSVLTYVHNRGSTCRASRIRLHDLRHTWATLALFAGEHPKVVQERLGHASVSITFGRVLTRYRGVARRCGLKSCKDHLRAG